MTQTQNRLKNKQIRRIRVSDLQQTIPIPHPLGKVRVGAGWGGGERFEITALISYSLKK